MLKFRWWCFINKLRMLKANAKYKKLKKSGEKIEIRIISESFPEPPWMEKIDYKSKEDDKTESSDCKPAIMAIEC